jgi:hypothetical protein
MTLVCGKLLGSTRIRLELGNLSKGLLQSKSSWDGTEVKGRISEKKTFDSESIVIEHC